MVGRNAVRLQLGQAYSRLHPVFNVSLVSPYVDPTQAGRPLPDVPDVTSFAKAPIRDWRQVAGIMDF